MLEDTQKIGKKRLGSILMSEGLITPEQVTEALEIQRDTGKPLGQVLVELGYITEYDLAKSLATQFQFPYINPSNYGISRDVLDNVPVEMMYKHVFIPLDKFGSMLIIAMAGLLSESVLQEIRKLTSCDVRIYVATARDVRSVLEKEVPIDSKLRKKIEGPSIAPVAAKVKKKAAAGKIVEEPAAAKKAGAKKAAPKKAAPRKAAPKKAAPKPEPAGLGIFDQAEAAVTATKKPAPAGAGDTGAGVATVGAPKGDVDWQDLFDEVDKSIREEVKKKKDVGGTPEERELDYDYD